MKRFIFLLLIFGIVFAATAIGNTTADSPIKNAICDVKYTVMKVMISVVIGLLLILLIIASILYILDRKNKIKTWKTKVAKILAIGAVILFVLTILGWFIVSEMFSSLTANMNNC